jgi:hypothetical protein
MADPDVSLWKEKPGSNARLGRQGNARHPRTLRLWNAVRQSLRSSLSAWENMWNGAARGSLLMAAAEK